MTHFKKLLVLAVFALAFTTTASAQALKIGYVDYEAIIPNMPEYASVMQTMQSEFQGSQAELQQLEAEFQQKAGEYEKRRNLMTEEQRQAKEQELQALAQSFQQTRAQKEQQFNARQAELMQPLEAKLVSAINEVAAAQQLDLVLRPQAGVEPLIVYASDRVPNITLAVAQRLGIDVSAANGQ